MDVPGWTRWQPFDSVEALPGGRWALRRGKTRTDIEIVETNPDRGIGYVALRLVGMREYRADITLEPLPDGGTDIRWRAVFVPALRGSGWFWEWLLGRHMRGLVESLARYAERPAQRG